MESSLGGGEETTQSEEGGGKLRWELNWETRKRDEMTRINIRLQTNHIGKANKPNRNCFACSVCWNC